MQREESDIGLAYFFFVGRGGEVPDFHKLLLGIASQLFDQCRKIPEDLKKYCSNESENLSRLQLEKLIITLLRLFNETYIVIDALDECSEGERVRQLLDKLLSLPSGLPIKFFLTSRPERHIRNQFDSPHAKIHRILRLHDIEKYIVDEDISLYLRVKLKRIRESSIGLSTRMANS